MTDSQQVKQLMQRAMVQSGCAVKELKITAHPNLKLAAYVTERGTWSRDDALSENEVVVTCPTEQQFRLTLK